jgi:hypothetical protein
MTEVKEKHMIKDFSDSKNTINDITMVDTSHYTFVKPIECAALRVNLTLM